MDSTLKRILVVDDDDAVLSLLTDIFSREGYVVRKASSAVQAIASFDESVHLVVSDLDMPGINGVELAGLLKSRFPIPVVAVTGLKIEKPPVFDAILHKPVLPRELLRVIRDRLSQQR